MIDTTIHQDGSWLTESLIAGIVSSSINVWGGRDNPIVRIDPNDDLPPDEWKYLEQADPDEILAFSPLSNEWVERFHSKLMPWNIALEEARREEPRKDASLEELWRWSELSIPGLRTPPIRENLRRHGSAKLLMLEFGEDAPLDLRRFFHRNFGSYYQWHDGRCLGARRIAWLEGLLPKINIETVKISDLDSACEALELISGCFFPPNIRNPLRFVAPCELSSTGMGRNHPWSIYHYTFRIFIGDTIHDFVEYWNEMRIYGCSSSPHQHALWVPASLTKHPGFVESLALLAYQFSGQHSSGARGVDLSSATLPSEELEAISSNLLSARASLHSGICSHADRRSSLDSSTNGAERLTPIKSLDSTNSERLRMTESTETIALKPPPIIAGDGNWAVDVQIEFGSTDRFTSSRWWCLPRSSGSEISTAIFRAPSRVTRSHLFAVKVGKQSHSFDRSVPELHVTLPADSQLVDHLILYRRDHFGYKDLRDKQQLSTMALDRSAVSDKGQLLRALIELFGDFWTAESFCKRKFWRDAFSKLSGHEARRSDILLGRLRNSIRKSLPGTKDTVEESLDRIIDRVTPHIKGALEDDPLNFEQLLELLNQTKRIESAGELIYRAGNTLVHERPKELVEEDIREGIDLLLARNFLRVGAFTRCRHCGIESWSHIDELRQFTQCSGCGNSRPFSAGTNWAYRLNTLAKRCISSRVLSVLQALASIERHSYSCFFYTPSFEIYTRDRLSPWREIDLACVSDGELILGEVKEGAFSASELERFVDAVELIRPERAAVFVPHAPIDDRMRKMLAQIEGRLERIGIKFELHQLPTF